MIAVGDHYLNGIPEVLIRASCPFGGGVGGCHEELCGVLSGGTLMLGALRGRVSSQEDDDPLRALVCEFRQKFIALAGSSQCQAIRDSLPDVDKRCLPIIEGGTRVLVDLLEHVHEKEQAPTAPPTPDV